MKIAFASLVVAFFSSVSVVNAETIDLLDGDLAKNWRGFKYEGIPDGWSLENGVLTFQPQTKEQKEKAKAAGKKAGGDLVTRKTFSDFELEMEWKIAKGGNSGIFVRANEEFAQIWHSSLEIQILDHENFGKGGKNPKPIKPSQNAGAIYDLCEANPESFKPHGEWNHVKIRVVGKKITVTQNGHLVADVDMEGDEFKKRFQASKFQKVAPRAGSFSTGFIGLQDHGGACAYRNIRVTEL